jgi:hypothetical protein
MDIGHREDRREHTGKLGDRAGLRDASVGAGFFQR